MIKIIEGAVAEFYPREMAAMFKGRAEVFHGRLGWDVKVKDGMEQDMFDEASPLYLVSVDPMNEDYQGSVRLLPTTGPNMLRDVFPQLLTDYYLMGSEPGVVESATIWESSRICSQNNKVAVLAELILGMGEVALLAGLTQIVSVFDVRMYRLLNRIVGLDVIGTPQDVGGLLCYAALFDCGPAAVQYVRDRTGIKGSVLEPGFRRMVA